MLEARGASVHCFSSFSYCSLQAHHNIAPASSGSPGPGRGVGAGAGVPQRPFLSVKSLEHPRHTEGHTLLMRVAHIL